MIGPAGSNRKENALALAEYFGWACISVGDLLKKEVSKKTEYAAVIQEAFRLYRYVPDAIVIELVKRQIAQYQTDGSQSWILEGFPRTQVQALSLQQLGVVPDKIIMMNVSAHTTAQRVKGNLMQNNSPLYGPELDEVARFLLHQDDYTQAVLGRGASLPSLLPGSLKQSILLIVRHCRERLIP